MAAPMDKVAEHHKQKQICASRPAYRQGRRDRAVKVYTVNQESRYLLVQGVPAIGVTEDLVRRFALYGAVQEYRVLHEYPAEEFTQAYWIKFDRLQAARVAKRKLDEYSFFGGVLHVSYAPEFETVDDTREKLGERRILIANKTRGKDQHGKQHSASSHEDKKKVPASSSTSTLQNEPSQRTNYQEEFPQVPSEVETFPALPAPPQQQWYHPAQQQSQWDVPKVASKQGVFPVGYDARLTVPTPNTNKSSPRSKTSSDNQDEDLGPLIGPQLPSKHQSGDSKEGTSGQSVVRPDLVPRQVMAGRKRPAPPGFFGEALDEDKDSKEVDEDVGDELQKASCPDTGSSSINKTANFVRQKMRQISQTGRNMSSGSRSSKSGSSSSSSPRSSKKTTRRRI
ncbi:PREDICTED: RNA-binding protein 48-like [Branchiostoma belcheri]|uniref:RNA-binding protein 48 n=1 Tax=Branchiostoma belcheri TaxID=7741 RepID=A0A6P4YM77_BRABE|nr:PREDICTED: RNA-binding protein 48-like [Branchiostoma belcheri]